MKKLFLLALVIVSAVLFAAPRQFVLFEIATGTW
jgi:uncharacterized membrane protein